MDKFEVNDLNSSLNNKNIPILNKESTKTNSKFEDSFITNIEINKNNSIFFN